ncbi:hypothetical protein NEDG_01245 [Nematocida displodere]|uniref:RING-type domain-containing protein n=1 Tax=Nematocida displodere TaxID=1805483 RepID=A0A177EBK1_9MICR|nr:hypothetical protein NEDG_01245 [Nematocida displodere]
MPPNNSHTQMPPNNLHTHSHTLALLLVLALTALAGQVLAVAEEDLRRHYIDSPHTTRTTGFFKDSGCALLTRDKNYKTYIKIAQDTDITIRLKNYTLDTVPDKLVQGMQFRRLTIIENSHTRARRIKRDVIEKIFRALGSVDAEHLHIFGLSDAERKEEEAAAMLPTDAKAKPKTKTRSLRPRIKKLRGRMGYTRLENNDIELAILEATTRNPIPNTTTTRTPIPNTTTTRNPIPNTTTTRNPIPNTTTSPNPSPNPSIEPVLLKTSTKHLHLHRMSKSAILWALSRMDVSGCELSLHLEDMDAITSLHFLESFRPKALFGLFVSGAENLADINCPLLAQQKVLNAFEVEGVSGSACVSAATLQAIASKHWASLALPASLWCSVALEACASFAVARLAIEVEFTQAGDPFWDVTYPSCAPSPSKLFLALTNDNEPASSKTFADLLRWVETTFSGAQEVEIVEYSDSKPLVKNRKQKYFSANPALLPNACVSYRFWLSRPLYRHSSQSPLWLGPGVYKAWTVGHLNEEMLSHSQRMVLPLDCNAAHPAAPLPPTNPSPDPECFGCGKTASEFNIPNSSPNTAFVGIVCQAGHMACLSCFQRLAAAARAAKESFCCLECNAEIADTGFGFVIERTKKAHSPAGFRVEITVAPTTLHGLPNSDHWVEFD